MNYILEITRNIRGSENSFPRQLLSLGKEFREWCFMSRLAYVIGIKDYEYWSKLNNPINDLNRMRDVLKTSGFETKTFSDLKETELRDAINNYKYDLKGVDTGLLYFAGHGVEINGQQYLLPTDARLPRGVTVDKDIVKNYVDITKVIHDISLENNFINIIILDCCRESLQLIEEDKSRGVPDQNSSLFNAKQGTFISFSTGPNSKASDGKINDTNGLFTKILAEQIAQEGLKIEEVFKAVRCSVIKESNNRQIPWEHSSLVGDFYFIESKSATLLKSKDSNPKYNDVIRQLFSQKLSYKDLKDRIELLYRDITPDLKNYFSSIGVNTKSGFITYTLNALDDMFFEEVRGENDVNKE